MTDALLWKMELEAACPDSSAARVGSVRRRVPDPACRPGGPSSTAAAPAVVPSPLAVLRCEDGRTGFADGFVETIGPVPELLALPDKADG